jgi:hypothetical protein
VRRSAAEALGAPLAFAAAALVALALSACAGGDAPIPPPTPSPEESYLVGRPLERPGIGDVELAFARYESTQPQLIARFREQPWFQDGLSREEALFVERALTFVGRYAGPRIAYVNRETVELQLYRYARVSTRAGEVELILIFELGQDGDRQMSMLKALVPVIEGLVGVDFPERVLTVVNGTFEVNDFNDGQFIRIARCCLLSPHVLAHELAHVYWSMGPGWFNEGMADLYSVLAVAAVNGSPPADWPRARADIDDFHRSRRALVDSGRLPSLTLGQRNAAAGLYEAASAFLLDIRDIIGHEAFLRAARDAYLRSDYGRYILGEKRVEDIFLGYTRAGERAKVMALFNRHVWGDNGERYQRLQELEGS